MRRVPVLLAAAFLFSCATNTPNRDLAVEYYNLGNAYFEVSQMEKAIAAYRAALRYDPGSVKASYNLALALVKAGRAEEAVTILSEILAGDPGNVEILEALAWTKSTTGADEEAIGIYERILAVSAENGNALYNLGVLQWKTGKKEEAAERFRTLLRYSPDDLPGMFNLGELLLSLDRAEEAADYLARYSQKKPEDAAATLLLALCQERLSNYARALELYELIIGADGKNAKAFFGKARLLLTEIEDPDKGLSSLQQALDLGFADVEAIKALIDSPLLLERDAVEKLLAAKSLMPKKTMGEEATEGGAGGNESKEGGTAAEGAADSASGR